MIGYFGERIFETSDKKLLTFKDFTRETASRFATHELINRKPITEFVGPNLQTVTFSIVLNASHGVHPRDEIDAWNEMAEKGQAEALVIGGKPLGADRWIVKSLSEAWNLVWNRGELYSAELEVTLEEYMEV
jgi:phage protein U